jgi:hypothetical protein
MSSLSNLRSFSNQTLTYTDNRPAQVLFDGGIDNPQFVNVTEGEQVRARVATNIIDVINQPDNIVYTIDLSQCPGAVLDFNGASFANLPTGVTANVVSNVYRIYHIRSRQHWDSCKSPNIILPRDWAQNWGYTSTIKWNGGNANVRSWSTAVITANLSELSSPTVSFYTTSANTKILGTPQITDAENTSNAAQIYTMITNSNSAGVFGNLASLGSGGTTSWNTGTGNLTITGTKNQVNSQLSNLYFFSNTASESDFYLNYTLTNPVSNLITRVSQIMSANSRNIMGNVTSATYNEDTISYITGPQFIDSAGNASATYRATISATAGSVSWIRGAGNTGSYFGSNSSLVLTGNRSTVNTQMATITMVPAADYTNSFTMTYLGVTPTGNTAQRLQAVSVSVTDDEITDLPTSINYTGNTTNVLFPGSTPKLEIVTGTTPTYTISLSSPIGYFGNTANDSVIASTYTMSGTRSQIQANWGNLKFYPTRGVSSDSYLTYVQQRNGVTQVTANIALHGTAGTISTAGTGTYVLSSGTWTPTVNQRLYLLANIVAIGGGGASGQSVGSGGGGGRVRDYVDLALDPTRTSYTVTVGSGGTAVYQSGTGIKTAASGQDTTILWFDQYGNYTDVVRSQGGVGGAYAASGLSYYNQPGGASGSGSAGGAMGFNTGSPTQAVTSGGGGGAGGVGQAGQSGTLYQGLFGGNGGPGSTSAITGVSSGAGGGGWGQVYFGAGGGGSPGSAINTQGQGGTADNSAAGQSGFAGNLTVIFHT